MNRLRNALGVERRAAEIVAIIRTEYRTGGWFEALTEGERIGWDLNEYDHERAPRNAREWAGWLAREALYQDSPASIAEIERREALERATPAAA